MTKKIEISPSKFVHEKDNTTVELSEALDKNVLILSVKGNKQHITTSFTKADLLFLVEFIKQRGVE